MSARSRGKPESLGELVDGFSDIDTGSRQVSLGALLETVGRRSFGALLLALGVIPLSPLSVVPGVSTMVAVLVLLIAGQFIFGRKYFWLPRRMLRLGVSRSKFRRALKILHPIARFVDRFIGPRLTALTESAAVYAVAGAAIVIGLIMPPLEMLPLANHVAGAALTAFGLGLMAHDGLLVIIAFAFSFGSLALLASALL
jgi:hypothetical protein